MFIHKSFYVKYIDDNALTTDSLSMKKSLFLAFFAFFCLVGGLFGTEIAVPNMEASSRRAVINGNFGISSSIEAEISYWEAGITLDIDNCHFLLEPRLRPEKIGTRVI